MAELKTKPTGGSVEEVLDGLEDEAQRADARALLELMHEVTGEPATMWGSSIVGFGSYHYRYASGREGDWFVTGFAPRKREMTLYVMPGLEEYGELLARLGKYKAGKGCLYVRRLADVDVDALRELISASVRRLRGTSAG